MFKETSSQINDSVESIATIEVAVKKKRKVKAKTKVKAKIKTKTDAVPAIKVDHLGITHAELALRHFITAPHKKKVIGCYFIQNGTLTYRESHLGQDFRVEVIAIKIKNAGFLGNSSASDIQEKENNQTATQSVMSSLAMPMIPFKVFTDAKMNISEFKLIEQGAEETIKRKAINPAYTRWQNLGRKRNETKAPPEYITESVHFIGASLFKVANKYFLFDLDRVELVHKIFNPFMSEIPKACKTIAEAYESLIPDEVKKAKSKGLKVIRQGEWFLIPVKGNFKPDLTPKDDREWLPKYRPMTLQAGPNRPNQSEFGVQAKNLCKGKFSHSGREHKTIVLKNWHKAVPNTAIGSFTISGDID